MRTNYLKVGWTMLALAVACAGVAAAAEVPAATVDPDDITQISATSEQSIGWRFFVDQEITITHLGVFDDGDDGLTMTHTMGIWRVNKTGGLTLMRQVDIGPGGTTEDHHVYVPLSEPITLVPDPVPYIDPDGVEWYERWLVGVWSGADNTDGLTIRPRSAATITAEQAGLITIENYTWKSSATFTYPWGNNSDYDYFGVNFKYLSEEPPPAPIDIDIKPGSYPNSINLGSNGVVPVAILSTADLDATQLPPENAFLAGSGVAVRGKGNKYLASQEDVNGDGLLDLVLKVETENLDPGQFQDGYAVLKVHEAADENSAVLYEGMDEITIVPPE